MRGEFLHRSIWLCQEYNSRYSFLRKERNHTSSRHCLLLPKQLSFPTLLKYRLSLILEHQTSLKREFVPWLADASQLYRFQADESPSSLPCKAIALARSLSIPSRSRRSGKRWSNQLALKHTTGKILESYPKRLSYPSLVIGMRISSSKAAFCVTHGIRPDLWASGQHCAFPRLITWSMLKGSSVPCRYT